jgi:hypothetical protein
LDECFDAEGYLPIHRAAQGGNLAAIKWFINVRVNTQLKTRSGLTALDISILYLGDISYGNVHHPHASWPFSETTKYRKMVFETLLQTFQGTAPQSMFSCGPTLQGLSFLHIAAVKGMGVLRYVHKEATEILPGLPINCVNKHHLDPVYLVEFYSSLRNEGLTDKYPQGNFNNIWQGKDENNIDLEYSHDSVTVPIFQYPDKQGEYLMAFHYLYHPPLNLFSKGKLFASVGPVSDCLGYYDNFPKFDNGKSLPDFLDTSECLSIRDEIIRLSCIMDIQVEHNCRQILKILKLRYITRRRRRYRQLSQFILKRLGWNVGPQVENIDDRWPFYFLHKMYLKKYKDYEYLKILNEALEVADIRFRSHPRYDLVDP